MLLFRAFSLAVSCFSLLISSIPSDRPADCRLHRVSFRQLNFPDEGFFLDDTPRTNWHPKQHPRLLGLMVLLLVLLFPPSIPFTLGLLLRLLRLLLEICS